MNQQKSHSSIPLTDYMFSKASRAGIPLSGTFELSPVCNFSCRMCYVRKTAKEVAGSTRPILTYEQWLEIGKQARDAGMLYLLLTGGEPLLWPDFWKLYEELIRMGFLISINTNGSVIDQEVIERFQRMPPKRINITLYGANDASYEALCRTKGGFRTVDRAITGLKEAGIPVKLNASLTPCNGSDLEELIAYADRKKLVLEVATYMFPPIRRDPDRIGENERFTPKEAAHYRLRAYELQYGENMFHSYLRSIEQGVVPPPGLDESCIDPLDGKIRCRAGKASFWITWDGWLTPCGLMPEPKVDLTGCSFGQAWTELMHVCGRLSTSGVCAQCPNQKICHTCAAMAIAETGKTTGIPKYLCQSAQEMRVIAKERLAES